MSGEKTEETPLIGNGVLSSDSTCSPGPDSSGSSGSSSPVETHPAQTSRLTLEIDDSQSGGPDSLDQEKLTSNMGALMNIMKTIIGTGVLGLPAAEKNAGLAVGTVGIAFLGAVTMHCMHLVIKCSQIVSQRVGRKRLTFAELAELSLATGPEATRRFSVPFRKVVNAFLVMNQIGLCSVYVVFVAENIQQVVEELLPEAPRLNTRVYSTIVLGLLLPCVLLRSIRILALASTLANLLTVISLVAMFSYLLTDLPDVSQRPLVAPLSRFPAYFGSVIFAMEGIAMVLPVYNKMKTPQDYHGCDGVLNLASVITLCIFLAVGFYGYLKVGEDARGSITLNLPTDNWLYLSVKAMFALAILLTYSVQMYVPVKILWPYITRRLKSAFWIENGEYFFQAGLTTLTYCMALVVPHLDILIPLVGAMITSSLCLVFPVIIDVATLMSLRQGEQLPRDACVSCQPYSPCSAGCCPSSAQPQSHCFSLLKGALILVLGILGAIAGTYTNLVDLINAFAAD